ncbi:Peroxidase 65 [Camellia lanceoleosa]|uniref:Peroxidase 65 n=1 Tax=Camellia lanceoleosa TaxID=1840588 RepID=A0ACC0G8C5_9ERIC|nr:Peroxidase 65 [Camellia lanceoleosa]
MALPYILLLLPFLTFLPSTLSMLTLDYYSKTCPNLLDIIQKVVLEKQLYTPTTTTTTLCLFFHDYMVEGCDSSILIASDSFNKAKHDAASTYPSPVTSSKSTPVPRPLSSSHAPASYLVPKSLPSPPAT